MYTQASVLSLHVSAVQLIPSSHERAAPALHVPLPLQVSDTEQNIPSSQGVPSGAKGLLHAPPEHTSSVH